MIALALVTLVVVLVFAFWVVPFRPRPLASSGVSSGASSGVSAGPGARTRTGTRTGTANGVRTGAGNGVRNGAPPPSDRGAAARWVDAGLITEEQARAIAAFEAAGPGATRRRTPVRRSRVSPAVEALAYVGGVLLAVGAAMLVGEFWDRMGTAGHLGVVGTATVVTGVVGAVVGEREPATWRLRGFLWGLSAVGAGAFAGLALYEVRGTSGEPVAWTTAATAALASAAYWWARNRPLQHAETLVATAVAVGVGIAWIGTGNVSAWIGLALWVLGAAWAALAWQRRLPPPEIGVLLGAVCTLVAAAITGGRFESLGPVLGLATAAIWIAIGIVADEGLALAPGVVGIFVFLPMTLGQLFGETVGAPAIVMASGVLLLGVVAMLLRGRRPRRGAHGRGWVPHRRSLTVR
jgi:hypothetical protein